VAVGGRWVRGQCVYGVCTFKNFFYTHYTLLRPQCSCVEPAEGGLKLAGATAPLRASDSPRGGGGAEIGE